MTDEELQQTIQELGEDIDKLSDPDKPLAKEDKRRKQILLLKKDTLERMKVAREKRNVGQELNLTVQYGLLNSLADKHPYLLYFLQSKFRMNIF